MSSRIAAEGRHLAEFRAVVDGTPVLIVKLEDDAACLRASLGGLSVEGYYLTFRGDDAAIQQLLEAAYSAYRAYRALSPVENP